MATMTPAGDDGGIAALAAAAHIPPEIERERLRAVDQVSMIATVPPERFDQVIRLAKMLFDVPMSSISVVDDRHQWFKAADGLGATSVPRGQTVCQVTIARAYREPADPIYVIEDASVSDFASLPGIGGDDGVRFYAGHPLYGPGGHPVGVFCIYDSRPRSLDAAQLTAFAELASWVQAEMERSVDLDRAAEVQRELLPREISDIPGFQTAALCLPAFSVGGDFYDHYVTDQKAYFSLVDVMGKGMGAAILTASVRSALRGSTRAFESVPGADLGTVFGAVAEQLADDFNRTASFATAFHGSLDPLSGTVEYIDAGHGLAFLRQPDGTTERLAAADLPLGLDTSWDVHTITMAPGSMLVVCSDGVLDALSSNSDSHLLVELISECTTPEQFISAVQARVGNTVAVDDLTIIAIRRNEL